MGKLETYIVIVIVLFSVALLVSTSDGISGAQVVSVENLGHIDDKIQEGSLETSTVRLTVGSSEENYVEDNSVDEIQTQNPTIGTSTFRVPGQNPTQATTDTNKISTNANQIDNTNSLTNSIYTIIELHRGNGMVFGILRAEKGGQKFRYEVKDIPTLEEFQKVKVLDWKIENNIKIATKLGVI